MSLFSIHLGYVLGSLPVAERFARARQLGFRAVEIPFPYDTPAEDYAAHLRDNGLAQISIGAKTTDYRKGEPGLAVDPARRADFRASLESAAAYATIIGAPALHVFSGGRNPALSEATMAATYRDNLAWASDYLASKGILTLIEPINAIDFPGYWLDSLESAEQVLADVGSPHIGIIFDVYHVAMMGRDPAAAFAAVHPLVRHVQFADFPGRHEPGTATLDFAAIVAALRAAQYTGTAGLEYIPTRNVREPFTLPDALAEYAGLAPTG
jgi:hydroxypyruvate isomerase